MLGIDIVNPNKSFKTSTDIVVGRTNDQTLSKQLKLHGMDPA